MMKQERLARWHSCCRRYVPPRPGCITAFSTMLCISNRTLSRSSPRWKASSSAFSARYFAQNTAHALVLFGDGMRIFQWMYSHATPQVGHRMDGTSWARRYDFRHATHTHVRWLI